MPHIHGLCVPLHRLSLHGSTHRLQSQHRNHRIPLHFCLSPIPRKRAHPCFPSSFNSLAIFILSVPLIQDNAGFICHLPSAVSTTSAQSSIFLTCSEVDGLVWISELRKPAMSAEQPHGDKPWSMIVLRWEFHGQHALAQSTFENDPL